MDNIERKIIRRLHEAGAQSKRELMDALHVRQNSVIDSCRSMERAGLLLRTRPDQVRNVPIRLNPAKFCFLGLEHLYNALEIVLIDGEGKIAAEHLSELPQEHCFGEARLTEIIRIIRRFTEEHGAFRVLGLGFADLGIVDPGQGISFFSVHVREWRDMPIKIRCEKELGIPCEILDRIDASCMEYVHARDKKTEALLQVWVTSGIGLSLMRNGDFWGRDIPCSCQLGHTVVKRNGAPCRCGNRGCLESEAGIAALLAQARQLVPDEIRSAEELVRRAESGDRACAMVLREGGEMLGLSLANIVNLTGISSIAIRSPLCTGNGIYLDGVVSELKKNVIYPFNRTISVAVNDQKSNASALGAALFMRKKFFDS